MNEEDLKKKVKVNKIIIGVLVVLLILAIIILTVSTVNEKNNNKNNNISNLGMVCSGKDFVFYYKYEDGIIKNKNGKENKISDDRAYSISYYDGEVYYTSPNNSGGIDIKKISEDGKNSTILKSVTTSSTKMYLKDEHLYYLTSNPNTISRVDLKGENEEVIITRAVLDFQIEDEIVYFLNDSGNLCKISVTGNDYSQLSDTQMGSKIQIYKNFVYYYKENKGLNKMSLKTLETKLVSDKVNSDVFNVSNKKIFYLDKENSKIYSMNLKGEKHKEIVTVNTLNTKINIAGNELYYLSIEDRTNNYRTYRIKVNGSKAKVIEY